LDKVDPRVLADALEGLLHVEETEGPHPDPWLICEVIDRLEASVAIERDRLIRLEFWLFPVLDYGGEQHAKTLCIALMSNPAFFTELLCISYKPEHGEHEEPRESAKAAAEIAWEVFQNCRLLPGTQPKGVVDREALVKFIEAARELCRKRDRLTVCDIMLGQILVHSPAGEDGIWPFEPAREVLDHPELEDMRKGFRTGAINKRGVTMRSADEGGAQERELATEYRRYANALRTSHPNLAATLDELAKIYEQEGAHEDLASRLHREAY
jgi:hypothetical protein